MTLREDGVEGAVGTSSSTHPAAHARLGWNGVRRPRSSQRSPPAELCALTPWSKVPHRMETWQHHLHTAPCRKASIPLPRRALGPTATLGTQTAVGRGARPTGRAPGRLRGWGTGAVSEDARLGDRGGPGTAFSVGNKRRALLGKSDPQKRALSPGRAPVSSRKPGKVLMGVRVNVSERAPSDKGVLGSLTLCDVSETGAGGPTCSLHALLSGTFQDLFWAPCVSTCFIEEGPFSRGLTVNLCSKYKKAGNMLACIVYIIYKS